MGTKLEELRSGCFARAMDDEPMFVLLGRDPGAPALVRRWAAEREYEIRVGRRPASDIVQVQEARGCANRMEGWREQNDGAWRTGLFARSEQLKGSVAQGMDDAGMSPRDAEADELHQREADLG